MPKKIQARLEGRKRKKYHAFTHVLRKILMREKLPDSNAFPDLLTLNQDTRIFPAYWIRIGQFKFPARQPYARQFSTAGNSNILPIHWNLNTSLQVPSIHKLIDK